MDMVVYLSFHPFSKVVCDYKDVHTLARCSRELTHNVHPSFHEGPWCEDGFELLWREMRYLGEALVVITVLDMIGRVRAQGWPVVALGEDSVGKAASTRVVPIFPLV